MGAIRSFVLFLFVFLSITEVSWASSKIADDTLTMLNWARVVTPIRYRLLHEEFNLLKSSCKEAATQEQVKEQSSGPLRRTTRNDQRNDQDETAATLSVHIYNNEQLVIALNEENRKAQLLKFISYHRMRLNRLLPPQTTLNKFFAIFDFGLAAPEIVRKNIFSEMDQLSVFVKNGQFASCANKIAALPKPLWGQL